MKIIYFCNAVNRKNGWCVINYYSIKKAQEKGHSVVVLTAVEAQNDNFPGVKIFPVLFTLGSLKKKPLAAIKSLLSVRRILRAEKPDIVHVLVEPYLLYMGFLRVKKLVFTIVGTFSLSIFQKSMLRGAYFRALNRVDKILSISDYTARRFQKEVKDIQSISVVPLGVDMEIFGLKQETAPLARELCFCFVGHIKPRKGLIYLLEAMAQVKKAHPTVKLYVAGLFEDLEYANFCQKFVVDAGLQENVKFLGRLSQADVCALYAKSLLNLLPSYNTKGGSFEGFGLIHLEANAAGALTLGCKESGNESAIVDGKTGFLVTQESAAELAEKMKFVIDIYLSGQYDHFSKNCMNYAISQSWDRYADQLEEQYGELLK